MTNLLLASLDRSLAQRARANAASAVRADAHNAAMRLEAVRAVTAQPGNVPPTGHHDGVPST